MNTASPDRRVSLKRTSVLSLIAVSSVLLALGACTKGRTSDTNPAPSSTASPAAAGIPTYMVTVQNYTYSGLPDTVPADTPFQIVFANEESFEITHEMILVQLPPGQTADDVIADTNAKGGDAEEDYLSFGEIGDVRTGATGVHTFELPPGNYVIACWEDGKAGGGTGPFHATIGMIKEFKAVAGASPEGVVEPASLGTPQTYHVSVSAFTYSGMPDTVPANTPVTIVFSNKESFEITHEMILVQLPPGQTADDVIADTDAKGGDAEEDYLSFGEIGDVRTGATGVHTFYLPPGNYVIACWEDGKAGGGTGPFHATIGMIQAFTVS